MPLLSCELIGLQEVHTFYHGAHKCTLHDLNTDGTILNASIPKKESGWTVTIKGTSKVRNKLCIYVFHAFWIYTFYRKCCTF